ncbi:MAG: hypothetical protein ACWA5U_05510 [bacterium]
MSKPLVLSVVIAVAVGLLVTYFVMNTHSSSDIRVLEQSNEQHEQTMEDAAVSQVEKDSAALNELKNALSETVEDSVAEEIQDAVVNEVGKEQETP